MWEPALGYLSIGVKYYSVAEKMKGTLSFVPSTMPPTSDSESQGCLFMLRVSSIINPSSLPQPRSGVVKRGGLLIWRLHRAASLRGTMRADPTHSPQGKSPGGGGQSLTFGPWFPGGSRWLRSVYHLHCPSPGQPTAAAGPQRDPEARTGGRNPPCDYWHTFPFSCRLLLPEPLRVNPGHHQQLRDWNLTSVAYHFGTSKANSGVLNPITGCF